MKKTIAVVALALTLVPSLAAAQERAGDAALGALSGAVVFGPVGAVAGALVGYTAGPSISHSWRMRGASHPHQPAKATRQEARASVHGSEAAMRDRTSAPVAPQPSPPLEPVTSAPPEAASTAPPVQGFE